MGNFVSHFGSHFCGLILCECYEPFMWVSRFGRKGIVFNRGTPMGYFRTNFVTLLLYLHHTECESIMTFMWARKFWSKIIPNTGSPIGIFRSYFVTLSLHLPGNEKLKLTPVGGYRHGHNSTCADTRRLSTTSKNCLHSPLVNMLDFSALSQCAFCVKELLLNGKRARIGTLKPHILWKRHQVNGAFVDIYRIIPWTVVCDSLMDNYSLGGYFGSGEHFKEAPMWIASRCWAVFIVMLMQNRIE